MEMCNGKIGISHADLMRHEIISDPNLKYYVAAGKIKRLRRGCNCTPALYEVDSFPERYRAAIRESFGTYEEQMRARAFIDTIAIDQAAAAYYEGVSIEGARHLNDAQRMLLTNSASILNAIGGYLVSLAAERARTGMRTCMSAVKFWGTMAKWLPQIEDSYPHALPKSPRTLQRKYLAYFDGGKPDYGTLVSGKLGNKNAAKKAMNNKHQRLHKQ